jgi:glutamate transport system permease protein
MGVVLDNLDSYLEGMRTTVSLTGLSFLIALVAGVVVATCRVSPVPPLRLAGAVWVEALRNTPLAVLFFLFLFGLPKAGVRFSSFFVSAVVVLSLYTSTFVAETVRSGINSVARGQVEAARALGLTFPQVLTIVVLPQALRAVVAPLASVLIALIKNSGIAGALGVVELTNVAERLNNTTVQPVAVFIGAAVAYVALALPTGWASGLLERRVSIKR